MVRPPYSNWYWACAAVLASRRMAAAANVFFILTSRIVAAGRVYAAKAPSCVTYITFMT
jgi:hypothetical protein